MLKRLTNDIRFSLIGSVVMELVVSDGKVMLDSKLTMKQHTNNVVSIGYYYLSRLKQLSRYITRNAIQNSFLLSRIDHCSSILIGHSASSTVPLRRVENAVIRLVMGL